MNIDSVVKKMFREFLVIRSSLSINYGKFYNKRLSLTSCLICKCIILNLVVFLSLIGYYRFMTNQYALIDSGDGLKLERFGPYVLIRPCSQAVWAPQYPEEWKGAHASFSRDPENRWFHQPLPKQWQIEVANIQFNIAPTDFGHLGIFPEQKEFWEWMLRHGSNQRVLNLFAYSGGSTLAAAKGGAAVCHLDASKGMVAWARENAALNKLEKAPIRWIVDDVKKFLARENCAESHFMKGLC